MGKALWHYVLGESDHNPRVGGLPLKERHRRMATRAGMSFYPTVQDFLIQNETVIGQVLRVPHNQVFTGSIDPALLPEPSMLNHQLAILDQQGNIWSEAIPASHLSGSQDASQTTDLYPQKQPFTTFPVIDKPTLDIAENALWNACRKSSDGIVSRLFNRNISLWISRRIVNLPISPNQWTVMVACLGIVGGMITFQGGYASLLAGASILQLCSILDGVDGELARIRMESSKLGQWLDTLCDLILHYLYFAGLTYVSWQDPTQQLRPVALAGTVGLVAWCGYTLFQYLMLIGENHRDTGRVRMAVDTTQNHFVAKTASVLRMVFRRDLFIAVAWLLAIVGRATDMLWFVLIGGTTTLIAALSHIVAAIKRRVVSVAS